MRPAEAADLGAICQFLNRELDAGITQEQWRALLDPPWREGPEYGYLLESAGRVVGYQGAVLSERTIQGKVVRVCNLTSWLVLPEWRKGLTPIALLRPYLARKDVTLTSLTPSPAVHQMMTRLGFVALEHERLILLPMLNFRGLATGGRVIANPRLIRDMVAPEHRKLLDDHHALGCQTFLAAKGSAYSLVFVTRRSRRRLPYSEILGCTDPALASALCEQLLWKILALQRTVAIVTDARIFGPHCPKALRRKCERLFRPAGVAAETVDNLYSELAILPLR